MKLYIRANAKGRSQDLKLGGDVGDRTREGLKAPSAALRPAWEGSEEVTLPIVGSSGYKVPRNVVPMHYI
jgi:hypothetical protein